MNISAAICEDHETERDYISSLVESWCSQHGHSLRMTAFPSAERFWSAYEDGCRPMLLLLDVEMPGQSGMQLAKRLRQLRDDTPLVFITGYCDHMAEGYEVSALHYLLKPVSAQTLGHVLGRAVEQLKHQRRFLLCSVDGMAQKVYFDEIWYIEVLSHTATIHGMQDYSVHMSMRELEQKLDGRFFRCHRSYIVNLAEVQKLRKTELLLESGEHIPVSRRLAAAAQQAFFEYYREKAEQ